MCTKSLHLEGIFQILFTSEGGGHILLRHPLTKAVYPSNWENTKPLKKMNKKYIYFHNKKQKTKQNKNKQTNKQTKSLYLNLHNFGIFFIIIVKDREYV